MIVIFDKSERRRRTNPSHQNSSSPLQDDIPLSLRMIQMTSVIIETDGDSYSFIKNRYEENNAIYPIDNLLDHISELVSLRLKIRDDVSDNEYQHDF